MSASLSEEKYQWLQTVIGVDARRPANAAGPGDGAGGEPGDAPPMDDEEPPGIIDSILSLFRKPKKERKLIEAPILGTAQQSRAEAIRSKMSPEDQEKFGKLLEKAGTEKEKSYVTKGLAAGHSIAELEAFQAKIAGKDDKWMQDNLKLTGDSTGSGIKQQWHMSCNATTAQAVKGELDPLYALKLHEENDDISKADDDDAEAMNKKMGAEQKQMLESAYPSGSQGGEASNRADPTAKRGRWNTDLLNNMEDTTGLKYANNKLGGAITIDTAITAMKNDAAQGIPLPIVIGNGPGQYTHYVLVTACDEGPPAKFAIHDPWEGKTYYRREETIRAGKINIAGSNQITAYENPSVVPTT